MRLTITGANSLFARAAIASLCGEHVIRAVDTAFVGALPTGVEAAAGDLRDRDFACAVTESVDAVLHLAPLALEGMDEFTAVDTFSRGSFNLVDMAIEQGVQRFVLASSLRMFDRLPAEWRVDEAWRPRPMPEPEDLACWLSELSLRECCHTAPIHAVCLRFGAIVTDTEIAGKAFDPRWLHLADAVQAVQCALRQFEEPPMRSAWEIVHISCGDRAKIRPHRARGEKFGYRPMHGFDAAPKDSSEAIAGHPRGTALPAQGLEGEREQSFQMGRRWRDVLRPRTQVSNQTEAKPSGKPKVVIFGSGGPVAAALAEALKDDYLLRQTDVRPLSEVRGANHPQSEGAPLPAILPEPHEERTVDIRDYSQVLAACEGMEAAVNCTVVRPDFVEAFRVNTLGAYHLMRAAVQHGIKRIVQTGPQQHAMHSSAGYWWDYEVPGNAPARPGRNLYAHSKFLGQEICRLFAEYYDLEIPVLLYMQFLNPQVTRGLATMAVSWEDSARALRAALEVAALPGSYEEIVITSDLPHGRYSALRAKEILGWEAKDDLSALWTY